MMLPNISRWRLEIALAICPTIFRTPAPADAGAFREGYEAGLEEAAKICDIFEVEWERHDREWEHQSLGGSMQALGAGFCAEAIRYRAKNG